MDAPRRFCFSVRAQSFLAVIRGQNSENGQPAQAHADTFSTYAIGAALSGVPLFPVVGRESSTSSVGLRPLPYYFLPGRVVLTALRDATNHRLLR
jgi:hypothetical protein